LAERLTQSAQQKPIDWTVCPSQQGVMICSWSAHLSLWGGLLPSLLFHSCFTLDWLWFICCTCCRL